jgi:hypothetical protein
MMLVATGMGFDGSTVAAEEDAIFAVDFIKRDEEILNR